MITDFAKIAGVREEDLLGNSRKGLIVDLRHLYWYFLNKRKKYTYTTIAYLNGRSRTTVYQGINKISGYLANGDKWTCEMWNKVRHILI